MAKKAGFAAAPKTTAEGSKKVTMTQDELRQLIEKRAFELFMERGASHGDHEGDWYRAEKEIRAKYKSR